MENEPSQLEKLPKDTADRLERAIQASPDAAKAEAWARSGRPQQLRQLTRSIAASYAVVENSSPPGTLFGPIAIKALATGHPLRQIWPDPSIIVRELMFRATHLYRSLGVLVAEAGSDITSSLPVLGRALLEAVSQVDWLLEPIGIADFAAAAGRVVARRSYLLSLAGMAGLTYEAEDFDFPDAEQLAGFVAAGRERGAELFGSDAVSLSRRNPDRWAIDGECRPRKGQLVDAVGNKIFSLKIRKSSHYRMPSSSSHASLDAPLGKLVPIAGPDNVHTIFCIDVDAVEGWLWYYTVWYRHGVHLVAEAHRWSDPRIAEHDQDATALFGRNVSTQR